MFALKSDQLIFVLNSGNFSDFLEKEFPSLTALSFEIKQLFVVISYSVFGRVLSAIPHLYPLNGSGIALSPIPNNQTYLQTLSSVP